MNIIIITCSVAMTNTINKPDSIAMAEGSDPFAKLKEQVKFPEYLDVFTQPPVMCMKK